VRAAYLEGFCYLTALLPRTIAHPQVKESPADAFLGIRAGRGLKVR
jgi:hypothetical protein